MDSDLLATCNALGHSEEERYFKDPDCLDTVKCLIKFLHQEDNNDIRIQLGSVRVVKNDLLPILLHYPDDVDLYSAVLRLLVNLTQPALLCFNNTVPTEAANYHIYLKVLAYNQTYKQDFSSVEIWKVLAQKVYDILEKEWEDRLPDDTVTVERILVLCRNVLHVSLSMDSRQFLDESIRDKLIIAMHNAGIDSMILYLSSSDAEQQWCLHVGEIIALLLREQSPGELATFNINERGSRHDDELKHIRNQENKQKKMNVRSCGSRHTRFGGTFVASGMPALVDRNDLVLHKSLNKCDTISFDEGKAKSRKAKNRRPVNDGNWQQKSSREVCQILKDFCVNFLDNSYNHFMFGIRDKISRERSDDHDETYYFSIMSFLLEFNRRYKFHIDKVSETIQIATLHFIDTSVTNCLDLMATDKKECIAWGRRMHCALKCYREFLLSLQMMQSSNNEMFIESAKVLLNNIFYTHEYREIFVVLLQKYDESKLSHEVLRDLIQTTHLFVRLFEKYCKGNSVIVKKTRKIKKKTKKRNDNDVSSNESLTEEERKTLWNEIEDLVKSSTQSGDLPEAGSPLDLFDPTSNVGEEEQQQRALKKIQGKLHVKEIPEAVVILRQARYLWPEIDIFGSRDATWEDDTAFLKECCLIDMTSVSNENPLNSEQAEIEDNEQEEEMRVSTKEVEYNFDDYMKKFAVAKVVQPYVILMAKFETNTPETNHFIVKMLHRIGSDMKMYGLLFQATVFRIFQKVFQRAKTNISYKELATFGKFIVRKFFEVLPNNDKLVVELLFWKQSVVQVYELTEGYGTFSKTNTGSVKRWSEAEQEELRELYYEFKDNETDVVDNILARITDETRTRHQVIKQLVTQGLVENASVLKRKKNTKVTIWREHEEMELRRLFEEFKDSEDPVGSIVGMMSVKRSKHKVIEKILELGLVMDRKELYKKRKRGMGARSGKDKDVIHAGGSDSEDDDDRMDGQQTQPDEDDEGWSLIDIQSCVRQATSDGLMEQVSWLKSNLEQAIEDRNQAVEDDEELTLPLVPLTEDQENAMQNVAFRKMLFFIGLQKPTTGQEMFWRIPPTLTVEQLQYYIEILSDTANVSQVQAHSEGNAPSKSPIPQSSDGIDDDESLRIKRKRTPLSDKDNSDSEDDKSNATPKRRKRIALDLSDDDDALPPDGLPGDTPIHGNDCNKSASDLRQRRLLDDDSEDSDSDKENARSTSVADKINRDFQSPNVERKKRIIISDDEDE